MAGLLDRERIIAKPGFNRWLVPPAALAIHAIGYLACLREPRVFDLWITKVSRCPRVRNWQRWGCNSYTA